MSGNSATAQLPAGAWQDAHMRRAWRTRDFRAVFHLACRLGLTPEIIADNTGFPLDLVLKVMKGNTVINRSSGMTEQIAAGLGMPDDFRVFAGLAPRAASTVPVPQQRDINSSPPDRLRPHQAKQPSHVGVRIAELRRARGLSQEDLAERAEVSFATVGKIEQGKRTPSLAMLDNLANVLEVPAAELIEYSRKGTTGAKRERLPDYLPAEVIDDLNFQVACESHDLGEIFSIALRSVPGLTVSHLARRCEMTVGQVTAYMQHKRKPHLETFDRVSDGLHIPGSMFGIGLRSWESGKDEDGDGKAVVMPYAKTSLRSEKRKLRERMRSMGLDYGQIAAEFSRLYRLRPRTAWREAYGWSLQEAADKINDYRGDIGLDPGGLSGMTSPHLCEYENWPGNGDSPVGRKPTPYLLAVLASIYGCHVRDLIDLADRQHLPKADLLIIDTYARPQAPVTSILQSGQKELTREPSALETVPATLSLGAVETGNFRESEFLTEEEVNTTLRRDFVALGGGLALARQLFGKLESELDQIHMTLDRGTTSEERTSYLEGTADDLGIQVVKVTPLAVLQPALKNLQSIRRLLDERQPTRLQVRLVKASSKLCIVVGEIMFNIGQFQKAREWYVTAEHAAYDIGDRYLADIALAGQAYLPTYSEDPNGVLTLLGPRLESTPSPSPAVAWLWGFTARAHATLNHSEDFKFAIERAQDSLEHSSPDLIAPGIFSFLPEKLAFYEATGAVRLNDTDRALNAANRALAMYDLSETTEPALAKLERASALARGGEVPEACRVATAAILDRKTYHGVTVRTYARKFDNLVHSIDLPETREWREARAEVHGQRTAIGSTDEHGL